jgi:hypothetical protein
MDCRNAITSNSFQWRQIPRAKVDVLKKIHMTRQNIHVKGNMLSEYNFKGKKGVRGKYTKALQKGFSIRIINDDGTVSVKQFVPRFIMGENWIRDERE